MTAGEDQPQPLIGDDLAGHVLHAASSSGSASSGSLARSVASRRIASMARRLAVVVSQAAGLSGIPLLAQLRSAAAYASCTHSSARSRSRATRAVAASTRAQ